MTKNIYNLTIFKWIDRETINSIIENCEEENFAAWETVVTQWDESNWKWYIIKTWSVKVSINDQKVVDLNEWNIVWEIALLNEEERTATVEALTDTQMIILTIDDLIDMINNDENKINKEIMRRIRG